MLSNDSNMKLLDKFNNSNQSQKRRSMPLILKMKRFTNILEYEEHLQPDERYHKALEEHKYFKEIIDQIQKILVKKKERKKIMQKRKIYKEIITHLEFKMHFNKKITTIL